MTTETDKVEAIRKAILAEAEDEAARLVGEAQGAVRRLVDEARAKADAAARDVERAAREEADRERRTRAAAATSGARARVLEARAAILEEARAAALLALDGVRATPDYPEVLKALVVEAALALAPADDLEVLIDERDEAVVSGDFLGSIEIVLTFSHNLATKLALANERIRTAGGVVVRGRGSRVRCDNTLEERLRAAWPDLSRRVAAEVYGEGAGG